MENLFICIRFFVAAFLVSRVFEEMSLLSPMEKSEQKKWNCSKAALNFKVDVWKGGAKVEPLEMLHTYTLHTS